jgi:branched-chain amino acid transport system permease protein
MGALSVSQFVDLMVGGLAVGCVYSLIALGFAMIMRATNIIHFAQGEVMMLGCMCGLTSVWLLPVLPLLAVVAVGMASSGIIAVAMELAVYRTLRRRRVPIMNLITATVGMSILCINAARIVWGSEPLRFPELFATTAYEFGGVRCSSSSSTRAPALPCRPWRRTPRRRSSWEQT